MQFDNITNNMVEINLRGIRQPIYIECAVSRKTCIIIIK